MNQTTSASGESLVPATTDIFTATHLVVIALLALVVIAGIVWGVRLARQRRVAAREVRAHNAEIRAEVASETGAEIERKAPQPERRSGVDRRLPPIDDDQPPAPTVTPEVANAKTEILFGPIPDASLRFASPDSTTPMAAAPVAATEPAGAASADGPVTQLKGLGAKLADKLAENGITTVGQLAALTDDEAAALDARLGPFTGRMARDRWQEQARFLAAGDVKGFEAVFGRL